jgi:hypothetical protein
MNANGLAKYYDTLTPWERVPLLIAALAHGDDTEFSRLKTSAPRLLFEVSDHADLITGLQHLASRHMMRQLDLTATYWRLTAWNAEDLWLRRGKGNDPEAEKLWSLARQLLHRFLVYADAWQRFCAELGIDPQALSRDYPGSDTLKHMEELARPLACSPEEAAAHARQRNPEAEPPTVEGTVQALRDALGQWVKS